MSGRLPSIPHVVEDGGYDTPCWMWRGYRSLGYGIVGVGGKLKKAHRVYWERENGPVPNGLELDHLCRNRACVNPDHLEAVTRVENCRRGLGTTLTTAQVKEIRNRMTEGETQTTIAKRFGVSQTTISDIKIGRSWKDIH